MGSVYPVPETRATVKITPLKLVKTRGVPPAEVKATVQYPLPRLAVVGELTMAANRTVFPEVSPSSASPLNRAVFPE